MRLLILSIVFCYLTRIAFSQGISDSVFTIQEVDVTSDRIFKKEEAGIKETRVDSVVLIGKINGNLSDILTENTTVYIKNYGRGALATASFRGTAPTHTQVSWNGININSPMLGMVDFSLIPVYIIDDLSLQHGAASISKQSGGLGGHISIDSKPDWNNSFGGKYYQGIGSFSTFDEFAQINFGNKKIQSKTRIYHNYSKNDYTFTNKHIFDIDPVTGEKVYPKQKNENADYRKYGISEELYIRPSDNTTLSAKSWYQNAYRHIPMVMSYEGSDTTNRQNRQDDNTIKAVINGSYYGDKLESRFQSGIDYQELDYKVSIMVGGYEENKPVNSGSEMFSWYNNFSMKYSFTENISASVNFDYNHFNISTLDSANQTGYDEKRNEFSFFSGMYFNFLEKINLSACIRKDWLPDTITPLIYNFGFSYKPFSKHDFVYKLSFARNYHNPTLNDLYWQPGGNTDLLPEEGYTTETGLHYIRHNENSNLEIQLTAYYSEINNWILWLPSVKGYWEPLNIKKVKSYGAESNISYSTNIRSFKIKMLANYAFTKSLNYGEPLVDGDESYGKQLPFIPVHSANAYFSVNYSYFYVNYQYQYYGVRYLLSSNRVGLIDDSEFFDAESPDVPYYQLYAQHLNHISIGKTFKFKNFKIASELKIKNLFNEVYRNVLNRFMPQRNYSLMLKFDF